MSLEEVGRRAGMAASTVSRLESGARRLALDHLPPLARALGVTVDELLAPAETPDPRVRSRGRTVRGITYWSLTRAGAARGLHAVKLHISAQRVEPQPRVHDGHDWIYVLSGRMRLILGDQDLVIEAGEAVEFSTRTPHWMGAVDGPVEALAIFGPQGEQVHLHR